MYNSIKRTHKFLLYLFIAQFVLAIIWQPLTSSLNVGYAQEMILSQSIMFGIPAIIYFFITKENPKDVLSIRPISILNILIIIGISIFIQPFIGLLSGITSLFFENAVSAMITETIDVPLWLMVVSTAVTPAIYEEIIFRGIVFNGYKTTSIMKACIMCGLLFAIMHMNAQQFLYTFVMGILFSFFVYKTKSIFSSVISHFTINASQIIMSNIALSTMTKTQAIEASLNTSLSDTIASIFSMALITVITLPILALLIWAFLKVNKNNKPEKDIIYYNIPKEQQEPICTISLAIIVAIFFIQVIILPLLIKILSTVS